MRATAVGLVWFVLACDSSTKDAAPEPAPPAAPALTSADVCAAYVGQPVPAHVSIIAAAVTDTSIEPVRDSADMRAQVVELRAESGAVENGERRIDGITLTRKFTLSFDGTKWTITNERVESRSEIFWLTKPADQDPHKLFGAQVIERYGPQGGTACTLPSH